MNIYTAAILLSILVYAVVGNYAGRRVKGLEDYFVVGRQAPTLLIVGTLVASYLSTQTFLSESAWAYGVNAGGWFLYPGITMTGYLFGAVFFGRYLRRSRSLTVTQYFADRFNSRRVQVVAGLTVVFAIGGYLVAVTQGAAIILDYLTPLTYHQALVVSWVAYTSFTMYSGSRGVVITDTLMFLLFTSITIVGMFFILDNFGGWTATFDKLFRMEQLGDLMSWHGITGPDGEFATPQEYFWWMLIIMFAWGFVVAISPWQTSRFLMARSEHVVMRSACVAALAITVVQIALYACAVAVNIIDSAIEPKEDVMIWASLNLVPPIIGALMLAGITAGALSSATTFLSIVGFNVSNDIMPASDRDERAKLRFTRVTMLVVGLVSLTICLLIEQDIFWITYFVGTIFASAWGPVAFMSVWSSRITESAAFWGILTGFLGNIIPYFLDRWGFIELPVYLHPTVVGAAISLAAVFLAMRFTEVTDIEREYRLSLLKTPDSEIDNREARRTIWYAHAYWVTLMVIAAVFFFIYVVPYQATRGPVAEGLPFDWFSAEALHIYSWPIVYIPAAIVVVWAVRKSYMTSK